MTTFVSTAEQAEAKGAHYIEEAVRVYLMRDLDGADKWVIDPTTFGDSLFSEYDDVPQNHECLCERPDDCAATVQRMQALTLPNGEELFQMLADALGYTVTKP